MPITTHAVSDAVLRFAPNMWTNPLLSSESFGWAGLVARRYTDCLPAHLVLPPMHEDVLIVTVGGKTRIDGAMSRRFRGEVGAPGSLFLTPRGVPAEWISSGVVSVLHLYIQPAFLAGLAAGADGPRSTPTELRELVAHRDPLLELMATALLQELIDGEVHGRLYAESLIHTLGAHLIRHYSHAPAHSLHTIATATHTLAPATLHRIRDYIQTHLAQNLSLAHLAAEAGLSPYHFARLFKQTTGQSVHQYVLQQRVTTAKHLLLTTKLSVAAVAQQVGFYDQSHLNRHFRHREHIAPSMLRDMRKK